MLLICICAAQVVSAGINQWTSTGPNGGYVTAVAWHPHATRSNVVFAFTDRVFRSTDSGASWVAVTDQTPGLTNFGFDPSNPDRILLSGTPVMRSLDGGATFAAVAGNLRIDSLAVSADGATVFGAAANKVYRSGDFGQTWTEIATPITSSAENPRQIEISPDSPDTLFINYTVGSLYRSTNGGLTWAEITTLTGNVNTFAINPRNGQQMLAATGSNATLWRSTNGGATWTASVVGNTYNWIAYDPTVFNRVVANQFRRLEYSTDGGGVWFAGASISSIQKNAGAFSPTIPGRLVMGTSTGIEISSDAGLTLQSQDSGLLASDLRSIAASRTGPHRVYASFFGGPQALHIRAVDGWQEVGAASLVAALEGPMVIEAIAVDPEDSSTVYVSGFRGVARSADAGVSWTRVLPPYQGGAYVTGLAVDPSDAEVIYAASIAQGILRSPDSGGSWVARNTGLPVSAGNVNMRGVYVDPADSQRIYAVGGNAGELYRSTDAGLNWIRVGNGLPPSEYTQVVAFDSLSSGRVYLGTNNGMYFSPDAGVTWSAITLPINSVNVPFVAIDPLAPWSFVIGVAGGNPGVLRTVDYGATWESVLWDRGPAGSMNPYWGGLDPAQPGSLIVGASRHGVRELQIAPDLSIAMSGVSGRMPLGSTPVLRLNVQNKVTSLFAASEATVSLVLPAALVPGSIITSRGSCIRAGQSVTCRMGALKVGEVAQIDLPLTVTSGTGNIIASIQGREVDPAPADNSTTTSVTVQPFANLRVTMTQPALVSHGDLATLDAQVVNLGPQFAFNARVIFTLPAGLVATSDGVCTASGPTVTCQLGNLPVDGSATIQLTPTAALVGQFAVSVAADSGSFDPDASNNSASSTITVRPVTDLSVTLGSSPAAVAVGLDGATTAIITNLGADPVNVAVAMISGTNLNVTAATVAGGSCAISSGAANCSLGALAVGAGRTIDVTFTPVAPGAAQLLVSTSSEAVDSNSGNNTASRTLTSTPRANLGVTLISAPAAVNRQATTAISARVTNAGPNAAPAARLLLAFPATTLSALSATTAGGSCTVAASVVDCALGNINSGDGATVDVTATGIAAGSASVTGTASTTAYDPVAGDNDASLTVPVRGLTDLIISMLPLPASLQNGQTANTTFTVTNNGPDEASITVASLAPVNLNVQSALPSAGTCSISISSTDCSLGALPAGASRTIVVVVATRSVGSASLSSSVSFEGGERVNGDNTTSGSMTVSATPPSGGGGGSGGSGGGGGALGWLGVLALTAWNVWRVQRLQIGPQGGMYS